MPASVPEIEEAGDQVADGDALQDAVDAPIAWSEVGRMVDNGAEVIDHKSEAKEGGGAADGLHSELGAGDAFGETGLEGEDDGGSDDEEEGGEDEVGGCESVPLGVPHEPPGAGLAGIVVDHDHEGDGEAAEDVKGNEASSACAGRRCVDAGRQGIRKVARGQC